MTDFSKPWREVLGFAPQDNPTLHEVSIRYEMLRKEAITKEQLSRLYFAYDDADHDPNIPYK
jgi:hypothetical protein